jgi:hypothetical protein
MQHIHFLDSISYLPMSLRKLPEAFGLLSNTKANLNYVCPIPDIQYFRADEMNAGERKDFLSWYAEQKDKR